MFLIIRLLINMVAILIISYVFPMMIRVDGFMPALIAAFLLECKTPLPGTDRAQTRRAWVQRSRI